MTLIEITDRAMSKAHGREAGDCVLTIADRIALRLEEVSPGERRQTILEWAACPDQSPFARMRRDIAIQWLREAGIRP